MKKHEDFQSIDKIKIYDNKLFRISTINILLIFCLLLTYYFNFILKTEVIFTHFFYIPIVLSSLWWSYKGILIAVFLSAILLVLHAVIPLHTSTYIDVTRALMFLTVSIIISFLIEKRYLLEGKLRTRGKSLEQKIYEWEESYKKLEESANKPIILIGLKGKLLLLNNCAASNFGGKPKDYITKTLWDIFPKKVADERFKDHQKVIQSGRSIVKEITVSFKGIEYSYLARIQPIRNKSGDVNSVLVLDNDITDRKKAEKYLVESEERYHTVFENTGTATMISEEDRTISMVNTQGEKLSGYSKEEIENKMKWIDFIIPEDLKRMKKYYIARRKAREKPPTEHEFRMTDKKGNVKDIFLKIGMIPNTKKCIASFMDITERKEAEKALAESEEKYRTLLTNINDLVIEIDSEGKFTYVSPQIFDMFGYTQEESIGLNAMDFVHPDDIEKYMKPMEILDKVKHFEYRSRHKNGHYVYVSTSGRYVPDITDGFKIVSVLRDITERKQAEERLKKTMNATIEIMSKIIEAKDPYTAGHQQRVSQLTTAIAKELNLSQDKVEGIRVASLIHDIGKIGLPTEILSKPTTLTDIEFNIIKQHSQIGYDILKSIDFSYPVAQIVLQHHERLDGSGYPNNLKGDKILLEAKILGVADVVEAMSSHRPYRPALGIDAALKEISKNRGTFYDPVVADACIKLFKEKGFKF